MTDVTVRHEPDGKITVCIDDKCVTVSCAKADDDDEPPFGVYLIQEVLADVDPAQLHWVPTGPKTRRAEYEGKRIWQQRVDD